MNKALVVSLMLSSLFAGAASAKSLSDALLDMSIEMSSRMTSHGTEQSSQGTSDSSESTEAGSSSAPDSETRVVRYVSRNQEAIARDISKGNGEALDALAELMNIPIKQRELFASTLQANFNMIYPTGKEDAATIVKNIRSVYRQV